jgi:hypothetical protein
MEESQVRGRSSECRGAEGRLPVTSRVQSSTALLLRSCAVRPVEWMATVAHRASATSLLRPVARIGLLNPLKRPYSSRARPYLTFSSSTPVDPIQSPRTRIMLSATARAFAAVHKNMLFLTSSPLAPAYSHSPVEPTPHHRIRAPLYSMVNAKLLVLPSIQHPHPHARSSPPP